jgi:hypothetical protein
MTLEDRGKVVEQKSDLYTTYDVTDKGYCINIKPRKVSEVFNEVKSCLEKQHKYLLDDADYFDYSATRERITNDVWDFNGWTIIHYVKGASEGYYVHVAVTGKDGRYQLLFLGKTLREGEAGISWAEQMVCAISRIMEV